MGMFIPIAQNPVIQPRSLWSLICNSASDDCYNQSGGNVFDEGTFNIFRFDGNHFWISFHGFDGVRGYRGIAKTANFITYTAGGGNGGVGEATPSDAIIDKNDGVAWREAWNAGGNIGAGHGNIISESGYYYSLTEMADKSLGCTAGQNWDFGLFRSNSLSNTTWSQFPLGNPILYSSKANTLPCNLQYAQIFRDGLTNELYLKYYRDTNDWVYNANYFYKLVKSTNLLKNADLWMGDISYWGRIPASPTNLVTYRYPDLSPDGTPVLATNCNRNPCLTQSVYQDVDVISYRGRTFNFGGQFSTVAGTGDLTLVVWQLDANYNPLQNHRFEITASNGNFTNSLSSNFVINSGAKYLRYEFYLKTGTVTYLADNMFLNLQ